MGGLSIKEYLLERKSIEGLYTVRRFFDCVQRVDQFTTKKKKLNTPQLCKASLW